MSEFQISVVEIGEIRKHENADALSVSMVHGGYPCIVKTGEFKEGDKAIYIPVDSMVPLDNPQFAFLRKEGENKEYHRVRALKLRGLFSMGLLIPADPSWQVGQNVQAELGIKKYEPPEEMHMGGEDEHCPFDFPVYTDIEGLRKWGDVLQEGEKVVISEKIHGANGRWLYWQDRLWVGSHNKIKRESSSNLWWKIAKDCKLEEILKENPGIVLYGEVYGCVQSLKYGHTNGKASVSFFDAMNLKDRRYLDYDAFRELLGAHYPINHDALKSVPILFVGPWKKELVRLAEGTTMILGADHIREGIVIKPVKERFDDRIGRVILKYHGEQYLTRKGV